MKHDKNVSEEMLNAFMDDQLELSEKSRILQMAGEDAELSRQLCELQQIKEMVRHAYSNPPGTRTRPSRTQHGAAWKSQALAALLLIISSAAAGWFGHDWESPGNHVTHQEASLSLPSALPNATSEKVILHISSSDPENLKTALDESEDLLNAAKRAKRHVQFEIIANGSGLDLLRADVSQHSRRIAMMQEKYPNLTFLACGQTVERLHEKNMSVQLLPGTVIATSALDQIVKRLQNGWVYVRA